MGKIGFSSKKIKQIVQHLLWMEISCWHLQSCMAPRVLRVVRLFWFDHKLLHRHDCANHFMTMKLLFVFRLKNTFFFFLDLSQKEQMQSLPFWCWCEHFSPSWEAGTTERARGVHYFISLQPGARVLRIQLTLGKALPGALQSLKPSRTPILATHALQQANRPVHGFKPTIQRSLNSLFYD